MLTSMITDKMRNAKNKVRTTLVAELVWERISPRPVRPNTDQIRLPDVLNKLKKREQSSISLPILSAKVFPLHNLAVKGTFNNDNSR